MCLEVFNIERLLSIDWWWNCFINWYRVFLTELNTFKIIANTVALASSNNFPLKKYPEKDVFLVML